MSDTTHTKIDHKSICRIIDPAKKLSEELYQNLVGNADHWPRLKKAAESVLMTLIPKEQLETASEMARAPSLGALHADDDDRPKKDNTPTNPTDAALIKLNSGQHTKTFESITDYSERAEKLMRELVQGLLYLTIQDQAPNHSIKEIRNTLFRLMFEVPDLTPKGEDLGALRRRLQRTEVSNEAYTKAIEGANALRDHLRQTTGAPNPADNPTIPASQDILDHILKVANWAARAAEPLANRQIDLRLLKYCDRAAAMDRMTDKLKPVYGKMAHHVSARIDKLLFAESENPDQKHIMDVSKKLMEDPEAFGELSGGTIFGKETPQRKKAIETVEHEAKLIVKNYAEASVHKKDSEYASLTQTMQGNLNNLNQLLTMHTPIIEVGDDPEKPIQRSKIGGIALLIALRAACNTPEEFRSGEILKNHLTEILPEANGPGFLTKSALNFLIAEASETFDSTKPLFLNNAPKTETVAKAILADADVEWAMEQKFPEIAERIKLYAQGIKPPKSNPDSEKDTSNTTNKKEKQAAKS